MSEHVVKADTALSELLRRYDAAKLARARWEQEEKSIKGELLAHLGYVEGDDSPKPVTAQAEDGTPVLSTKIGTWRGLDQKRLKAERPDVWAQFETSKPTIQIKYE